MTRWETERSHLQTENVATYGSTLTYKGAEVSCICPPKEYFQEMQRVDYIGQRSATFTITRDDFDSLSIAAKDIITSAGTSFMVYAIIDDDAEPTVDLRCNLLQ